MECLADLVVGQLKPCTRHHFQLTGLLELAWKHMKRSIHLPCSFFNLAVYWPCNCSSGYNYIKRTSSLKGNTYLSAHLVGEDLHSHLFMVNTRCTTAPERKKKSLQTYFLMLCFFFFFFLWPSIQQ